MKLLSLLFLFSVFCCSFWDAFESVKFMTFPAGTVDLDFLLSIG